MVFLIKSCRLCRCYDNIYTTLNHVDSDNLTLFQKLNRITPGILESNANLPDGICMNCITELNNAHKFITKCSESQAIFQRYLEQLENEPNVQPVNNQEILIKAIKLDKSNCNLPNSVTVKDENEIGFLNKETNVSEPNQSPKLPKLSTSRYPKRSVSKRNYAEDEDIPGDHYIYCDECMMDYINDCHLHEFIIVPDNNVPIDPENLDRARQTVPKDLLKVTTSKIPNSGEGVWALKKLKSRIRFGPYEGETKLSSTADEKYSWELKKKRRVIEIIDGANPVISNWMRYVNCARTEEEQNLVAFQYCGKMYYRTVRDIEPNTELLVYYGDEFAKKLGIDTKNFNSCPIKTLHDNVFKCKGCNLYFASPIYLEQHSGRCIKRVSLSSTYGKSNDDDKNNDEEASQFSAVRDHGDSFIINNGYRSTEVNVIKTDGDEFKNDSVDLLKNLGHFYGFDLVERNVANSYKVKYGLKLKRLCKVLSKEHTKNVDAVLERSEIGKNSSNVNINIQAPYKCKIYNEICKNRLNLTRHKRTRTGRKLDKPYQCAICGRATISKSDLKKHIRIHTNEKPFICETCNMAFNQSSNLKKHICIHTNEKPFKCETCNKAFTSNSDLKRHIRIHTNEKPFICETCNMAFNQSSNLKKHIRIHTNEGPFKCETCNKAFTSNSDLKRHIRIHTNEKPFICETCNMAFNQSSNLKKHIRNHTNEKPFKCETCNKAFPFNSDLKKHILIHTNKKPFICETCNMAFNQFSNLKKHIRNHTNEKPFKCETCNKAFPFNSDLKNHIRIHTNEKPFKCETCNKDFSLSSNLIRHIRIHTNEKPFKCETCNKDFSQSSNLIRHIRIHTNEKPFKCETCNMPFNQSSTLKKHIRIHTNEKPFK